MKECWTDMKKGAGNFSKWISFNRLKMARLWMILFAHSYLNSHYIWLEVFVFVCAAEQAIYLYQKIFRFTFKFELEIHT